MTTERDFDLVVVGASGYTGRLVAEYLANTYGNSDIKWAMAGRSLEKLATVRDEMGISADTPLIQVDSHDEASVTALVQRTHVVITTVGPYQLYGNALIGACAQHGTDYVDLSGEPGWMHDTIAAHSEAAKASGARLVHSCGFDSIPFDLGVFHLQQHIKAATGATAPVVKGRVRAMNGSFSGARWRP